MTSVARNTHMPNSVASSWFSRVPKCSATSFMSDRPSGPGWVVGVWGTVDPGHLLEILLGRRRAGAPLQSGRTPGIVRSARAAAHRPDQIEQRQYVTECEHAGAGGGELIEDLELRRVVVISARHAREPEHELWVEGQIEADEDQPGGDARPALRVHAPDDLRPPEMQAAEIGHDGATDHDVVKVRDDEIGRVQVH